MHALGGGAGGLRHASILVPIARAHTVSMILHVYVGLLLVLSGVAYIVLVQLAREENVRSKRALGSRLSMYYFKRTSGRKCVISCRSTLVRLTLLHK